MNEVYTEMDKKTKKLEEKERVMAFTQFKVKDAMENAKTS